MTLPLPFKITEYLLDPTEELWDPQEAAEAIQGNFDHLGKQFPFSRAQMSVENPHVIGAVGEIPFEQNWVNFDTTIWSPARYWRTADDMVHLEGTIKSGINGNQAFTLPADYRPILRHNFAVVSNNLFGRVEVRKDGKVIPNGSTLSVSLDGISFRRRV